MRIDVLARNPALRRIVLAGLVSGLGDRMHQVALAALVLALTDSVAQAALVFVVSTVPYVLFGLMVGALIDRWDRRRAMIAADLARAALVAMIPLAVAISLPLVYLLLFVVTCARMVFAPAQQAALPDLVAPDDLPAANSLTRSAEYLSDVIGYPLAALMVVLLTDAFGSLVGARVAFGLDALSFVASALLLARLPSSGAIQSARAGRLREQIGDGLRFLARHPQVRTNTLLFLMAPLLLGSTHTLWVGFAWHVSLTGALGFGVTEALTGVGVLAGVWLLRHASQRLNKGRVILLGFLLYGAAILAAGTTDSLALGAILAAVAGTGNMLFLIPSVTLVQQQTPSALRGRVLGVRLTLTYAAFAASNALAGGFSQTLGVSLLMMLLGGGAVLMAGLAYLVPSAREAI